MGGDELIESLRKTAEEEAGRIWRDAEEEAGRIWAGISARLEAVRQHETAGPPSEEEAEKILRGAETRARTIRLQSEDDISRRLFSLAESSLGHLREKGCEEIFGRLVLELPPSEWLEVAVNPQDTGLAKKYFPRAEIRADGNIKGGMKAGVKAGVVQIINTFEKRLERSWPHMLADMLVDIRMGGSDSGTPPKG